MKRRLRTREYSLVLPATWEHLQSPRGSARVLGVFGYYLSKGYWEHSLVERPALAEIVHAERSDRRRGLVARRRAEQRLRVTRRRLHVARKRRLRVARCVLHVARRKALHVARYTPIAARGMMHVACGLLQVACCTLHADCCMLHVAGGMLHNAGCMLVRVCMLHVCCMLHAARCTLHAARCLLHSACCMWHACCTLQVARCTFIMRPAPVAASATRGARCRCRSIRPEHSAVLPSTRGYYRVPCGTTEQGFRARQTFEPFSPP